MKSQEGGAGFVTGFLLGGLVGAAAALLLTPRSGEEARDTLVDRGIVLKVKAEEVAAKAREEADEILSRGKTVLEDQRARLKEAVEEGKGAAAEKKAELLAKYRVAKATGESPEPEPPLIEALAPEPPQPEEEPESGTQQG
ncbi:MAG: YtxH domain-containing protein [Bacteroidetes bacterium]|nr:YtxH domain-containing protein [Bacteroidota bacterium]